VRAAWRLLGGQRDLRLMLSAGLVSMSGDWILLVGLLYRVYAMTGSTVATALTMMSAAVPQVLLGPVAGMFADRWDRKRAMIVADLLMAAGLLPLLAVHDSGQVWIVLLVLLSQSAVEQFFNPAQQAMVPRLVPDNQLPAANALNGQVQDLSRLAGSALGGVIAAIGGLTAVALADSATFVASATLLVLVRASGRVHKSADEVGGGVLRQRLGAMRRELRDGVLLSVRHRFLRALMLFVLITSTGEGIFGTLITPFLEHVLHASSQEFGLVRAAQAVGGISGGLLTVSLSQRVPATRLFCWGAVAFGAVDLAFVLYPLGYGAIWPAVTLMIIAGFPAALVLAGLMTLFQRHTEDAYRGRVFGALGAAEGVAMLAGTLAGGYLSQPLGIIPVLAVQGSGYILAGFGMFRWLKRGSQEDVGPRGIEPLVSLSAAGADHSSGDRLG
jgi:predicted MFS family arabinose efflux permease